MQRFQPPLTIRFTRLDSKTGACTVQMAAGKTNQAAEGGQTDAIRGEGRDPTAAPPQRYSRRLSDKILIAFHHACDQADFAVAQQLLQTLEMMLNQRPLTPDGTRRRNMESLVAAHERLWHLRHMVSDAP